MAVRRLSGHLLSALAKVAETLRQEGVISTIGRAVNGNMNGYARFLRNENEHELEQPPDATVISCRWKARYRSNVGSPFFQLKLLNRFWG